MPRSLVFCSSWIVEVVKTYFIDTMDPAQPGVTVDPDIDMSYCDGNDCKGNITGNANTFQTKEEKSAMEEKLVNKENQSIEVVNIVPTTPVCQQHQYKCIFSNKIKQQ